MSGPLDVGDLVSLLDTSDILAGQQVKELVLDNLRGTKEVWLVNALVDSYVISQSARCLDIIASVSEPHDKHVFDRLLDHLRGPNKLSAMTILAALVYKQPPWLHKLIQHDLFKHFLKSLKVDTDIPVLLSGSLVLTSLLPTVPVGVKEFLPHIFDIFSRLANFCLKTPGTVPELYKYHLKVGVYCLHNRLYGMFPYNFLTYLRNIYFKQEQQSQVFNHIIKPMIEKLRLHPQLFTTSRDNEVSIDRWRHKEVHDILVECAQFSLDLTEGSTSEMSTPGPQKMDDHVVTGQKLFHALSDLAMPSPGSLIGGVDPATVLGLQSTGVMTPPPGLDSQSSSSHATGSHVSGSSQPASALSSPAPEAEKTPMLSSADKFPVREGSQKPDVDLSQILPEAATFSQTATTTASSDQGVVVIGQTSANVPVSADSAAICEPPSTPLEMSLDQQVAPPGGALESAPSVSQLPKILDMIDIQAEEADNEVTVITTHSTDEDLSEEGSDTPSHLPAHLKTAESVAAFMKKVHRLRFNSINVTRESSSSSASGKMAKAERSRSCPTFKAEDAEGDGDDDEYRASTLPKQKTLRPRIPTSIESSQKRMTRCNSSQTSLYTLSAALLDKVTTTSKVAVATESSTETDALDPESPFENFPYQELFSLMIPFSPYVQCYSCVMNNGKNTDSQNKMAANRQPVIDDRDPLFATYSPSELLDRILDQANVMHGQQKALTPGGKPIITDLTTCTDPGLLRGQVEMLHSQLMYERHKRELHAQRNRRLLSRIVKTTALQEENIAMKDQLQLQERELLTLRHELTQQQRLGQHLRQATAAYEADTEKMQKSYAQKMETLQTRNKDVEAELEEAKQLQDKAHKDVQSLQAAVYTLTKEVEALTAQTQVTNELKEQVKRLNKELLLMGELQQKYQSRLVELNTNENSNTHTQFLVETYKIELNTVKNNLSQKTIALTATEGLKESATKELEVKDEVIDNLKQTMEAARDTFTAQIESVEQKYHALKKSHLALQTEFMTLNHQIGCMKAAEQRSRLSLPRHGAQINKSRVATAPQVAPVEASGASTAAEGGAEWVGEGNHQAGLGSGGDCPAEWSAPASVSSVESAEEAVAMDTSQ